MAGASERMKPEGKRAFDRGIRELRLRITQAEYCARLEGYQETQDQLTWLLLDLNKLRDEIRNHQNQGVICLDSKTDKDSD
jgi:hypothetical protein